MLKLPTEGDVCRSKYPRDIPPPGTQQHTIGRESGRAPTRSGRWMSTATVRTPAGATSPTATLWERRRSGRFEALGQDDGLRLEVLGEALGPELAPETRVLEAAEGRREVHAHAVHAVGAGAHAARDVDAGLRVAGPHRAREAVVGVVGDAHRIVDVVVGDDRQDGTEDLLLGDGHRVVDVGEDRRLDVPALVEAGRPAATGDDTSTFVATLGDVALDPVAVTRREHRTDRGFGIERVAHLHGVGRGRDGVDDLAVAGAGGEDAGLRHAGLAVVHDCI